MENVRNSPALDLSRDVPLSIHSTVFLLLVNQFEGELCHVAHHDYFEVNFIVPFTISTFLFLQFLPRDAIQISFDYDEFFLVLCKISVMEKHRTATISGPLQSLDTLFASLSDPMGEGVWMVVF